MNYTDDTHGSAHQKSIWTRFLNRYFRPAHRAEILEDGTSLTILPWMNAHALMMGKFPEYTWEFTEDPEGREVHYFNDGTAEVRCRMTIGPTHRSLLFVRDLTAPSATQTADRSTLQSNAVGKSDG